MILLVEDNPADEELTRRSLEKSNVANDLIVVHDGAEALDFLFGEDGDGGRGPSALPTVVLLDLKLPKVDGLEVLRRIRGDSRTRLLPVVVLTSSDEEKDIVDSYSLGANSFVSKPVAFADFGQAVASLGLYWVLTNVSPPGSG